MSVEQLQASHSVTGLAKPGFVRDETPGPPPEDPRRLAATYEQAGIGVVEIDAEGKILRVNDHLSNLLGLTPHEMVGRSLFDLSPADDVIRDKGQYQRQVAGEIDGYSIEKRFRRKDGSAFWVSATSRSVKDPDGRFLYAVSVQQDISDRKRAEDVVRRRGQEQAALHQLTARLQHAAELKDVYAAAMNAMFWALDCERASVLLFDAAGVMRFVAARGLSEAYSKAVEGHSPWSADARRSRSPIFIDDVEAADLPDDLKAHGPGRRHRSARLHSAVRAVRLIGKFMTYYDRAASSSPRHEVDARASPSRVSSASGLSGCVRERAARSSSSSIVESSDDAIVSKDLNGIVQPGTRRRMPFRIQRRRGRSASRSPMLIPQDRLDEEPEILARIRRGERVDHFETVRQRKDGSLIDISLTISPVRDPNGRSSALRRSPATSPRSKEAEARLRDSERQLQDFSPAIPAAIYTTDAEGRITYYNEAAVEFAGRDAELGSDEWCVTWKLYWPDGTPLPHDQCPMAIALKEGRPIRGVEAVAERPDGTRVPFIPYPTPLRDADGNVIGAINMLVDISERKEAETQQRILLNELNHRVKNNMQMLQSLLSASIRQTKSEEARRTLQDARGADRRDGGGAARVVLDQRRFALRRRGVRAFGLRDRPAGVPGPHADQLSGRRHRARQRCSHAARFDPQ